MFTFSKLEDGFQVFRGDRAVAIVAAGAVEITVNDKLKDPYVHTFKPFPKAGWQVHFCGVKLPLADLETFLKELAAQEF